MLKKVFIMLLAAMAVSCNWFQDKAKPEAIARAGEAYLYPDDIAGLVPKGTSKKDSTALVKAFINKWASQKLLYSAAEINLNAEKQEEYNRLANEYKSGLYTHAYLEQLVKNSTDTVVTLQQLQDFYNADKENFRINSPLVQMRYIYLAKNHPKFSAIKSRFMGGGAKNIKALDNISIQFKSYAFNDTTWVDMDQVYQKLPFITQDNSSKYIANGISYEYPDSADVYLVKVVRVLGRNQVMPFEYSKPMLQQLIINNRKMELIKKFEKEITDDAIKNNEYEIYK